MISVDTDYINEWLKTNPTEEQVLRVITVVDKQREEALVCSINLETYLLQMRERKQAAN